MSEAADVTRAIRSFTDEDAAARPAGMRRPKPVIAEPDEELPVEQHVESAEASEAEAPAEEVSEKELEVGLASEETVADASGAEVTDPPVFDQEGGAPLPEEDVRTDYEDP